MLDEGLQHLHSSAYDMHSCFAAWIASISELLTATSDFFIWIWTCSAVRETAGNVKQNIHYSWSFIPNISISLVDIAFKCEGDWDLWIQSLCFVSMLCVFNSIPLTKKWTISDISEVHASYQTIETSICSKLTSYASPWPHSHKTHAHELGWSLGGVCWHVTFFHEAVALKIHVSLSIHYYHQLLS